MQLKLFIRIAIIAIVVTGIIILARNYIHKTSLPVAGKSLPAPIAFEWTAPDTALIPHSAEGEMIRYGRKLIANTAEYIGPRGIVNHEANGMNCQNCHLDAGTRAFANSFAGVASMSPQYRPRSGRKESIEFKINECLERSLNGNKLDSQGLEMKSMVAYIRWVGQGVPKGIRPRGAGTEDLPFMNRPADTVRGKFIYQSACQSCHGVHGEGILKPDQTTYLYPPLWGEHSYNVSAGMYRLGKLAGYIKYAMPLGITLANPRLTDEQTWDLSAFINSRPRPVKFFKQDWPRLENKPVDFPFGPYTDSFSEEQHKYGPFAAIQRSKENLAKK